MAIIGKNLVTTPRFPTGTEPNGWKAYVGADQGPRDTAPNQHPEANPITGGAGYRMYRTGDTTRGLVGLDVGELEQGATYYVWLWARLGYSGSVDADKPTVCGLLPLTSSGGVPLVNTYMSGRVFDDLMKQGGLHSASMTAHSVEITIPDMTGVEVYDTYGDTLQTFASNDGIRWVLAIRNDSAGINFTSIGGARLDKVNDYDETPPTGYADGTMGELYSWQGTPFESISLIDDGIVGPTVIVPPVATFSDEPPEYTLPETTGAAWLVNSEPAEPGTYTVEPTESGVTVSVIPEPLDGYVFEPDPELQQHTWTLAPEPDPDPDPDPDPEHWAWPEEPTPGGRLVARWLKWDTADELLQASFHYEVARAFVWGYTRGRGFDDQMEPTAPLQRVIVSGAARLAYNPENVNRWQVSSESEVLTVFNGFNLAEQGILNRYRKRWA